MTLLARKKLAICIPCFNEADNVVETVNQIINRLPEINMDVIIYLVDDGSVDKTREKMIDICNRHKHCKIITFDENHGIGHVFMEVVNKLEDDVWVTIVPGDNEIVFESIFNLLALSESHDVILGYLQNPVIRTIFRRFCSYSFMMIVRVLYGFPFRYVNGLILVRCRYFKNIDVISKGHAFMPELLAKSQLKHPLLRITEAPFSARGRSLGNSKAIRPSSIFKVIYEVINGYCSVSRARKSIVVSEN